MSALLQAVAAERQQPESVVIQEAIEDYLHKYRPRSVGLGSSGRGDLLSERVDELLWSES
ncbi:MAG: hypothetical protein Q6M54_03970 [Thermostichus sp. DRC_bins_24]